jgi:hypothetical protein
MPRMGVGGSPLTGGGGTSSVGQTSDVSSSAGDTGVGATSGASTSATGGGGGPLTCNDTNGGAGCCDPGGVLHYCDTMMNVVDQPCDPGMVCGWSKLNNYYDCVAPPVTSDPSNQFPIACGGGGGGTSSSSSSASSSSSTGGGGSTTWTQIYTTMFGPQGTSACSKNGGCHTNTQSGLKCGTSKSTCYTGFVNSGYVAPGANASSSALVNPVKSPLCGSLGGNMPKNGNCITAAQLAQIKSWLANGAQND